MQCSCCCVDGPALQLPLLLLLLLQLLAVTDVPVVAASTTMKNTPPACACQLCLPGAQHTGWHLCNHHFCCRFCLCIYLATATAAGARPHGQAQPPPSTIARCSHTAGHLPVERWAAVAPGWITWRVLLLPLLLAQRLYDCTPAPARPLLAQWHWLLLT